MSGIDLGNQLGTFNTLDEARQAAAKQTGNEAIVKTDDGKFAVRDLKATGATAAQDLQDAASSGVYPSSELSPNVLEFSLKKADGSASSVSVMTLSQMVDWGKQLLPENPQPNQPSLTAAQAADSIKKFLDWIKRDGVISPDERKAFEDYASAANSHLIKLQQATPMDDKDANKAIFDAMGAIADAQDVVGSGGVGGANAPPAFNEGKPLPGSLPNGQGQFTNPVELLSQISQIDRYADTHSDEFRCGAHAVLAAAIQRGPSKVQAIVDQLKAKLHDPKLNTINVQNGLNQRDIALIADGMFRFAHGANGGLEIDQIAKLAKDTGVSANASHASVSHDDLKQAIGSLKDGDAMVIGVDFFKGPNNKQLGHDGIQDHAISLMRRGPDILIVNSEASAIPHVRQFSSAEGAMKYLNDNSLLPTQDLAHKPLNTVDIARLPAN